MTPSVLSSAGSSRLPDPEVVLLGAGDTRAAAGGGDVPAPDPVEESARVDSPEEGLGGDGCAGTWAEGAVTADSGDVNGGAGEGPTLCAAVSRTTTITAPARMSVTATAATERISFTHCPTKHSPQRNGGRAFRGRGCQQRMPNPAARRQRARSEGSAAV